MAHLLDQGLHFGLPTEAQWEYACRAGTTSGFNNGRDDGFQELGWFDENSKEQTQPVGRKRPNALGLYDMHGNVWEWCNDWFDQSRVDRVVRGGSWFDPARLCRSAFRSWRAPGSRLHSLGFRVLAGQASQGPEARGAERPKVIRLWTADARLPNEPTANWAPDWASSSGTDAFGRWAAFELGGAAFRFRWIEPGQFWMGSRDDDKQGYDEDERPRHQVTLTAGFWLAETQVTQAQWLGLMEKNPSHFKGPQRPVERVTFHDCQQAITQLNQHLPGLAADLPSEAEWEFACRAGTDSAYHNGQDEGLEEFGWFGDNSDGGTHPVAEKAANTWGLYDMHGNVDEWCKDGQRGYQADAVSDPLGPMGDHVDRVVRGGSWSNLAWLCRSAFRFWYPPGNRNPFLGFRVLAGRQAKAPEAQS